MIKKNLEGCNEAHDKNKTHLSNFKAIYSH
jgi:hypothetical protein